MLPYQDFFTLTGGGTSTKPIESPWTLPWFRECSDTLQDRKPARSKGNGNRYPDSGYRFPLRLFPACGGKFRPNVRSGKKCPIYVLNTRRLRVLRRLDGRGFALSRIGAPVRCLSVALGNFPNAFKFFALPRYRLMVNAQTSRNLSVGLLRRLPQLFPNKPAPLFLRQAVPYSACGRRDVYSKMSKTRHFATSGERVFPNFSQKKRQRAICNFFMRFVFVGHSFFIRFSYYRYHFSPVALL